MTKDLTQGNPAKLIFRFSLPVIAGNLFQVLYTLADTVIVGRALGASALAAVGATGTIIYFILCFVQGFTGGFGIVLAQAYGAGDEEGVRKSAAASVALSLAFTVIITGASCALAMPFLRWMSTPGDIIGMSYDYLIVIFAGTFTTIFYNLFCNILRSLGDSRTPLYFLVLSSVLNVVLDFVLMVPIPLGVAGAAWATVISQLVSVVLCLCYAVRAFPILRLRREDWRFERELYLRHLKIGFPMGFQMSVMCIGQLAMQLGVNKLGTAAVAGYTAATKIDQFPILFNGAYGITISSFVAQNYGANQMGRIRRGVRDCLMMTQAANIACTFLMLFGQGTFVPIFVDNPSAEILLYARDYIYMVAPFYVLLGFLQIYRTAIQSVGNSLFPFLACVIELICRCLSAGLLSRVWGYRGICLSSPAAWLGAAALLIPVYYTLMKRLREAAPNS